MMIFLVVWGVSASVNGVKAGKARSKAQHAYYTKKEFERLVRPPHEMIWDANDWMKTQNSKALGKYIGEFVGEPERNWEYFVRSNIVRMIALAKQGKLLDIYGESMPWHDNNPAGYRPNELYGMMERLMLRVEDELRSHGVDTRCVATYDGGYTFFYPVREWVKRYGYGNADHMNFTTKFSWEQMCTGFVFKVPQD